MMTNLAIPKKIDEWMNVLVDLNWIKLWNEMALDSRRQGKQKAAKMEERSETGRQANERSADKEN